VTAVSKTTVLQEELSDRLTQRAELEDRPVSRIVSQAVLVYLAKREGQH
jgi:predicted transcriptional regulator